MKRIIHERRIPGFYHLCREDIQIFSVAFVQEKDHSKCVYPEQGKIKTVSVFRFNCVKWSSIGHTLFRMEIFSSISATLVLTSIRRCGFLQIMTAPLPFLAFSLSEFACVRVDRGALYLPFHILRVCVMLAGMTACNACKCSRWRWSCFIWRENLFRELMRL